MSTDSGIITRVPVSLPTGKLRRALGYGAVGVTGIPIDLAIVELAALWNVHHLFGVVIGYQTAMTWNFLLQRGLVYKVYDSNIVRQYIRYLFVDITAFAVRVGVVLATVRHVPVWGALPYVPQPIGPAVPASAAGIALAFLVGFQGTDELVFGGVADARE